MQKIQGKSAPHVFLPKFRKPSNSYATRLSHLNYVKPIPRLNKCNHGISYRRPAINVNMEFLSNFLASGLQL